MRIGVFLSCEEHGPRALVDQAVRAQEAGFHALAISDHYHPWNDEQGHSPFVWPVIGAIAQATDLPVKTAVTCPTIRVHPAVVAQAAATCSVMLGGRFTLGVGTGEALNEHVLGGPWPEADVRLEMLEEAIEVMRTLWQGGQRSHRGRHYTVENARIYDLPDEPPRISVSGFGPKAIALAAQVGDGYTTTSPDAQAIERYRFAGGTGPVEASTKVCFMPDEQEALRTVHRLWPNEALPGELAQILPTPAHFEQACELVTPEMLATPVGPDVERHVEALRAYEQAGVDELFVGQIGPGQDAFFDEWAPAVLPRFAEVGART
ncbi:MAG TPA: TIGR03557 family F420-dependent LLM class oxidoreductase [Solirubrobacteraceae bacterium]|nr:TIGR03557 family F420-dependent LLM class oxidoreductase [Solirubrobacteraceae bacterium]